MIEEHFVLLFAGAFGWVILVFVISAVYRWRHNKPLLTRKPTDASFLETWTSGHSNRSILTKLGGARSCLLVAVTPNHLVVRPHFPFNLLFLPEVYDLDYVIPRKDIRSVKEKARTFGNSIEVVFSSSSAEQRSIELRLRHPKQFLKVLESP